MNKRGFATIGIMMAVLFVSMVIIGTFFNPIYNTSVNIENSKSLTPKYIDNMNGLERLHATFYDNVSRSGEISFEDLNKSYKVDLVSEDYSIVNETIRNNGTFNVNNKTYLNIEFEVESSKIVYSYDIEVKLNGKVIVENKGLKKNTVIEIGEEFLYNEETGETNYGEFEINVVQNNAEIVANVEYENLDHREVIVSNEDFSRNIEINNKDVTTVNFK